MAGLGLDSHVSWGTRECTNYPDSHAGDIRMLVDLLIIPGFLVIFGVNVYIHWIKPDIGRNWLERWPTPWIDSPVAMFFYRVGILLMFIIILIVAVLRIGQVLV